MIYGLTGFAGSGKDTTADYLVEHHGFIRVGFADKLREFCLRIDPTIRYGEHQHKLTYLVDNYGWDVAKREFIEVREFMQKVGESARETFSDLFWIDHAFTPEVLANERIVVSDVRYQNEIDYIAALDGFIIRIYREGVGPVNNHSSEQPLPFDYKVNNPNGYVPGLYANLDDLVRNISRITG